MNYRNASQNKKRIIGNLEGLCRLLIRSLKSRLLSSKGGEKRLREKSSQAGEKIIVLIKFEEDEVGKLEVLKRHFGLKQNKEAIKALITEKCAAIKLAEEQAHRRQIEEAKAMEWLEKGEYSSPLYD